ncbi:MAG TPA: flagellar biosynthetic protein FliR [Sphingomicrobium sp.]|nr:flagellar biosynthetic protein FliR [Sphingomicrobium sp.]
MQDLQHALIVMLLVSLRIVPTLAFSPPFTLMRVPATVRLLLCLALSAWMMSGHPAQTTAIDLERIGYLSVAASELVIGMALALALQLAYAALLTVGRAVDLQAGYAFAMLADPSTRVQTPLIGMLFAYAAAAIFFATNGPADLLAVWSISLDHVPLGAAIGGDALQILAGYLSAVFVMAFGGGGLLLLTLFLIDASIALISRTLPQMNVLFLGFQVKAIATLVLLPIALAGSAALFVRMFRFALDTMLQLV